MPVAVLVIIKKVLTFAKINYVYILMGLAIIALLALMNNGLYKWYNKKYLNNQSGKDVVIEVLKESNEELIKANKVIEDTSKIDSQSTMDNITEKDQIVTKQSEATAKLDNKVSTITDTFNKKIEKEQNIEKKINLIAQKEKRISQERINSLWDAYCKQNSTDKDCK